MEKDFNYGILPEHMRDGVKDYVEHGLMGGSFMRAAFENKLVQAYSRADETNQAALRAWVSWLYNDAPMSCWGSEEKVDRWSERGGYTGIMAEIKEYDDEV